LIGLLREAVPNHLSGSDPFNIEDLCGACSQRLRPGWRIAMSHLTVEWRAGTSSAKALDQPVYRLLGGAVRENTGYANGWYTVETHAGRVPRGGQAGPRQGLSAVKPIHSGLVHEIDREEQIRSVGLVEAVRDAVGPNVEIMIEMHGRFNPATAIDIARNWSRSNPAGLRSRCRRKPGGAEEGQRADPHPDATGERINPTRVPRVVRATISGHHPAGHHHFGGIPRPRSGGVGRRVLRAVAPHNVGGRYPPRPIAPGGLHDEFQDSRAL